MQAEVLHSWKIYCMKGSANIERMGAGIRVLIGLTLAGTVLSQDLCKI